MKQLGKFSVGMLAVLGLAVGQAFAGEHGKHEPASTKAEYHAAPAGPLCDQSGMGPQTPRDIDNKAGNNPVVVPTAPAATEMHLCNLHMHEGAEHKSKEFSIFAGEGHEGHGSGYQCAISKKLTKAELAWSGEGVCKSDHGDLKPGDTIEVHWVHTSCDVPGGKGLGACVTETCKNPQLRVEAQVFTLVAEGGLDFAQLQTSASLPTNTGKPVEFAGSTTGPKYDDHYCSDFKVTWSVRPQCAKLNIKSVGEWCKGNKYEEDHAHGVRKLVTSPTLLAPIK